MNVDTMIDQKFDVLIEHIKKLKKEGRVEEMELMGLLDQCYTEIIPPVAKMFVRRGRFIALLMERKDKILEEINGKAASFLSLVK